MRVKMLKHYAGPRGSCSIGGIMETTPDEAKALVKAGAAELVDPAPPPTAAKPIESAAVEPATEVAIEPTALPRRRKTKASSVSGDESD